MAQVAPVRDVTPADWVVAALPTFGESVLSLVPAGFGAYVRVFHPARRRITGDELVQVRWADIATANGTHVNPAMQLNALTRSLKYQHQGQPGVYDVEPREGSLPTGLAMDLANVLARHTDAVDRCWFAVWNGFGATRDVVRSASTFRLPNREYYLLGGLLSGVTENALDPPWEQSPNLWWPDDRAWFVATEIDLNTTYIGCSEACRDEILATPELEALAIDPTVGIDWRSDPVNPWPGE